MSALDIFRILPENFFSILCSKHKHVYFDALLITHKAFMNSYNLKKEDLISLYIEDLNEEILSIEIDEDDDFPNETNLSSQAHRLFRRLKWAGWINVEYLPNSFDEYVILEDHARKFINLFIDILNLTPKEYNGYVYNTYVLLKDANERRDDYAYNALVEASKNTFQLDDALRSLLNNIKQYHQSLNDQDEIKEMLKGHIEFNKLIANKIIYPLKTFDSFPRFKPQILKMLKEWQYDIEFKEILVSAAVIKNAAKNQEEARDKISVMIGEIIHKYSEIDSLLDEINRKNNIYTRAWAQKIFYTLNADKSIKGKIVEILKVAVRDDCELSTSLFNLMNESLEYTHQNLIDEASVFKIREKRRKTEYSPLKISSSGDAVDFKANENEFKDKIRKFYSLKKVKDYVLNQLKDKDFVCSNDLRLSNEDEFVLFILSVLRSDENSDSYNIQFSDGNVFVNGYRIPDLTIKKKKGRV